MVWATRGHSWFLLLKPQICNEKLSVSLNPWWCEGLDAVVGNRQASQTPRFCSVPGAYGATAGGQRSWLLCCLCVVEPCPGFWFSTGGEEELGHGSRNLPFGVGRRSCTPPPPHPETGDTPFFQLKVEEKNTD